MSALFAVRLISLAAIIAGALVLTIGKTSAIITATEIDTDAYDLKRITELTNASKSSVKSTGQHMAGANNNINGPSQQQQLDALASANHNSRAEVGLLPPPQFDESQLLGAATALPIGARRLEDNDDATPPNHQEPNSEDLILSASGGKLIGDKFVLPSDDERRQAAAAELLLAASRQAQPRRERRTSWFGDYNDDAVKYSKIVDNGQQAASMRSLADELINSNANFNQLAQMSARNYQKRSQLAMRRAQGMQMRRQDDAQAVGAARRMSGARRVGGAKLATVQRRVALQKLARSESAQVAAGGQRRRTAAAAGGRAPMTRSGRQLSAGAVPRTTRQRQQLKRRQSGASLRNQQDDDADASENDDELGGDSRGGHRSERRSGSVTDANEEKEHDGDDGEIDSSPSKDRLSSAGASRTDNDDDYGDDSRTRTSKRAPAAAPSVDVPDDEDIDSTIMNAQKLDLILASERQLDSNLLPPSSETQLVASAGATAAARAPIGRKQSKASKKLQHSSADLHAAAGHHHGHHPHYYQYVEVPKKKTWKYGFKRGNHKHEIEKHEKGHKHKFHTTFKWHAKEKCKKKEKCKSVGKMVWEYKHHKKHHA